MDEQWLATKTILGQVVCSVQLQPDSVLTREGWAARLGRREYQLSKGKERLSLKRIIEYSRLYYSIIVYTDIQMIYYLYD